MSDIVYLLIGNNAPGDNFDHIAKYDGVNPPTVIAWALDKSNRSSITCLKYSTNTRKLYIHVDDFDNLTVPNGNSQGSIYELDPANDAVRLVVTYTFTDGLGDNNQPCSVATELNGFIYWVHQAYTYDNHIVKFDPVAGTVALVTPIHQSTSTYGQGFLVKQGTFYYWADSGQIFRTSTPDVAGSWALWWDGYGTQVAEIICPGDFLGTDYYFAAVNDWGNDGRGNPYRQMLEIFKLDASGTVTKVYQNDDQGLTNPPDTYYLAGWIPSEVRNVGGKLIIPNLGIDRFQKWNGSGFDTLQSSGMVITSTDGSTWTFEEIPYATYLAQNYDASCGPQGTALLGGNLYLVEQFNDTYTLPPAGPVTTGQGFGTQLLKRDAGGTWARVQHWASYQLFGTSQGPDCQIALIPSSVVPPPPSLSADAATCAIVSLARVVDTASLCTRVIPYGAGNQTARVTLAKTTRPLSGTFTDTGGATHHYVVDAANNYLYDTDAEATYGRIESVQTFGHLAPVTLTPSGLVLAANALFDVALVYLEQHCTPVTAYSLEVAGLQTVLYPGQTIRVIWKELNSQGTILDLDLTLIILEATNKVTQQGFVTTALTLSNYPRYPLSDAELLAKLELAVRQLGRYGQPLELSNLSAATPSGYTLFAAGNSGVVARATRAI